LKERCFDVFLERNERTKYGEKDTAMNYTKYLMGQTLLITPLSWARHLIRMDNDRTLKKLFNTKTEELEDRNCDGKRVSIKI